MRKTKTRLLRLTLSYLIGPSYIQAVGNNPGAIAYLNFAGLIEHLGLRAKAYEIFRKACALLLEIDRPNSNIQSCKLKLPLASNTAQLRQTLCQFKSLCLLKSSLYTLKVKMEAEKAAGEGAKFIVRFNCEELFTKYASETRAYLASISSCKLC
jgi:hypothetical protein